MNEKNKNEEIQTRREFFKKAARATLPVLGAVVLSSLPFQQVEAHDCGSSCSSTCYRGCQYGCGYNCNGLCRDNCTRTCYNTCKTTCDSTCKGTSKSW